MFSGGGGTNHSQSQKNRTAQVEEHTEKQETPLVDQRNTYQWEQDTKASSKMASGRILHGTVRPQQTRRSTLTKGRVRWNYIYELVQHHCHYDLRKFNVTNWVIPMWNSLSNHVVSAEC